MRSYTKFDEQIKKAVSEKAAEIYPSEDMFCKIKNRISEESERGNIMNTGNIKRTRGVLIACIILILTTVTCFAAVKIASYTGHSTNNDFKSFPTEQEMKKTAGFLPDYIETFSNGFTFESGGVGEMESNDESGNAIDKVEMTTLAYEKDGNKVFLNVENGILSDEENSDADQVAITKELTGTYVDYMNKVVPPDYEQTEQDKKDEANGTLVFSYGSDKVETNHVQSINWIKDGMRYSLLSMDDGVTKDELIEMVAEISAK